MYKRQAITFIGRLALAALILVVLVEVYFLARGFNLYREAIEEAGLDEMAASIQSSESFTPIDELPDLYLQAVVAVEDHRFYAHPGFDAIATARALVNDLKAVSYTHLDVYKRQLIGGAVVGGLQLLRSRLEELAEG